MAPKQSNELPNTPGPKLRPFKNGKHKKVQFVKGLGSGAHSHVWKVKIDGKVYALKMFRHICAEEENDIKPEKLKKFDIDLQLVNGQLTPFNCEARAYGRLQETGKEDIAWKCYGYIALDEETYSSVVWDQIGLPRREWFSQTFKTDDQVADREVFPIYALVKEFIPDAKKLGAIDVSKAHAMAECINALHSVGITHRDIQDRNFVDSRIMDFSTSWTVPNIRLDRELGWDLKRRIDEADMNDYFMFDSMIEQNNGDYRMTTDEKYRTVKKSRAKRSASESSDEEEEIPMPERIRNNSWLVLASTYKWKEKIPPIRRLDLLDPIEAQDSDGGSGDAAARPSSMPPSMPPSMPLSSRLGYRRPDPKLPRFTMLWSWSAAPPRMSVAEVKKLEDIRKLAVGIIRGSNNSANSTIKGRAEDILKIIDNFNDGVAGDDGDDDTSPGTSEDKEQSKKRQRTS